MLSYIYSTLKYFLTFILQNNSFVTFNFTFKNAFFTLYVSTPKCVLQSPNPYREFVNAVNQMRSDKVSIATLLIYVMIDLAIPTCERK